MTNEELHEKLEQLVRDLDDYDSHHREHKVMTDWHLAHFNKRVASVTGGTTDIVVWETATAVACAARDFWLRDVKVGGSA